MLVFQDGDTCLSSPSSLAELMYCGLLYETHVNFSLELNVHTIMYTCTCTGKGEDSWSTCIYCWAREAPAAAGKDLSSHL